MIEMCKRLDRGCHSVRNLLKMAQEEGFLETKKRHVPKLGGGTATVPVYRVQVPKKTKGK